MVKSARDTRDRILRAAAEVFASRGYAGATTRAICAAAGVNAALVNYHFRSKADLYQATLAMLFADMASPLMALPDRVTDEVSWRGALCAWVRMALSVTAAEQPPESWCARLMAQEQCLPSAMADEIHRRFAEPVHESLRRLVRMGQPARGDEVSLNLKVSGAVAQCLVYALHDRWERSFKPRAMSRQAWLERVADDIVADLTAGLAFLGAAGMVQGTVKRRRQTAGRKLRR